MSTERIVKFTTETSYEQLPTEATNAGKLSILIALGVALAACQENASKIINEYVAENEGKPEAGVIGGGFKTSAPQAALGGKFSLEFCVSIALIDGEVHLKQFTDERVQDSAVQELMKKIKYAHPPEMGAALDDLKGEVVVKLRNGKSYLRRVDIARGTQKNPLSWEEVSHKYRGCCITLTAAASIAPMSTVRYWSSSTCRFR